MKCLVYIRNFNEFCTKEDVPTQVIGFIKTNFQRINNMLIY